MPVSSGMVVAAWDFVSEPHVIPQYGAAAWLVAAAVATATGVVPAASTAAATSMVLVLRNIFPAPLGWVCLLRRAVGVGVVCRVRMDAWVSDEKREQRAVRRHALDAVRGGLHPLQHGLEVLRGAQLDADERGAGLAVVALDVLEQRDVVVRAEHVVEEAAQRAGLLRELDEEVVLATLEDQCPLD